MPSPVPFLANQMQCSGRLAIWITQIQTAIGTLGRNRYWSIAILPSTNTPDVWIVFPYCLQCTCLEPAKNFGPTFQECIQYLLSRQPRSCVPLKICSQDVRPKNSHNENSGHRDNETPVRCDEGFHLVIAIKPAFTKRTPSQRDTPSVCDLGGLPLLQNVQTRHDLGRRF